MEEGEDRGLTGACHFELGTLGRLVRLRLRFEDGRVELKGVNVCHMGAMVLSSQFVDMCPWLWNSGGREFKVIELHVQRECPTIEARN